MNRRRFLQIAAAAGSAAALPGLAAPPAPARYSERGVLLGADAEIQLYHFDARAARAAMADCFAEVRRLESIFSLQQPRSALSRLNREGQLARPPHELAELLGIAAGFSRATAGAFDFTVQPLWALYAHHFAGAIADASGPRAAEIDAALARVDYRRVAVSRERIVLDAAGMAVTLNGIAQGFITDRVTEMLRSRGFGHVLVDMGEMRALGQHADGTPWRIGIADPHRPWRTLSTLSLRNQAIATSGGYGTPFDSTGRHHHLFDPRTGRSANYYRSVSVVAPDATTADALSTGVSALPPEAALAVLRARSDVSALLTKVDGEILRVGSVG